MGDHLSGDMYVHHNQRRVDTMAHHISNHNAEILILTTFAPEKIVIIAPNVVAADVSPIDVDAVDAGFFSR
jgi:hypothetical protein